MTLGACLCLERSSTQRVCTAVGASISAWRSATASAARGATTAGRARGHGRELRGVFVSPRPPGRHRNPYAL